MNFGIVFALIGLVMLAEVLLGMLFVAVYSAFAQARTKNLLEEARALRQIDLDHSVRLALAMADLADERPLGDARRG